MNTNAQPQTTIDASSVKDAVLLYGHSHNSYADSGPDYDATQIAKKYMDKFDIAMKEMGYSALFAAEIEASDSEINNIIKIGEDHLKKEYDIEETHIINRFYVDDGGIEATSKPRFPNRAADEVNSIKHMLLESTRAFERLGKDISATSKRMLSAHSTESREFTVTDGSNANIKGGHINISLHPWARGNTESSLIEAESAITSSTPLGKLLFNAIRDHQLSDGLAFYDGTNLKMRRKHLYEMDEHENSAPDNRNDLAWREELDEEGISREISCIENRLPSAACNHHLAILSNLATIYNVLSHFNDENIFKRKIMNTGEQKDRFNNIFNNAPKAWELEHYSTEDHIRNFQDHSPTLLAMETLAKHAKTQEEEAEIRADAEKYTNALIERAHRIDHAIQTGEHIIDATPSR